MKNVFPVVGGSGGISRVFYDEGGGGNEGGATFDPGNDSFLQYVPEASRGAFEGITSFNQLTENFVNLKTNAGTTFDPTKFTEHMPEDIRGQFATVPNLEALGRGYLGAQKMLGKDPGNILEKPAPGDQEAMVTHLRALGAAADVASFDKTGLVPDGAKVNEDFLNSFIEKVAVPAGMLPHQVKASLDFVLESNKATTESQKTATATQVAKWQAELAQLWGVEAQSPGWKENCAAAESVVAKFGGEEVMDFLDKTGAADHPGVIEMLRKVGAALSGADLNDTGAGGPGNGASSGRLAAIETELADLRRQQMDAMNDIRGAGKARGLADQIQTLLQEKERLSKKA